MAEENKIVGKLDDVRFHLERLVSYVGHIEDTTDIEILSMMVDPLSIEIERLDKLIRESNN